MIRNISILFLVVLFTILQATLLNYIQIFCIKPDILLVLVAFVSLNLGRCYGLSTGVLCALFTEASSGLSSGSALFVYSLAGLVLGHMGRLIYPVPDSASTDYRQKILAESAIVFIFTFTIYSFLFLLLGMDKTNLSFFGALFLVILPAAFYTAFFSPLIFRFLKLILNIKDFHAA
jgi:rod shape-determining protein MreD